MLKQKVQDALKNVFSFESFHLLSPKNPDHGDYAFHTKQLEQDKISSIIEALKKNELFSNVELVGGFVNLTISPIVLLSELTTICEQKDKYGTVNQQDQKKILLEFGQPNTHKLPHIGHLFSYTYGESLARLLSFVGNAIFRANYQGDVGLHVAKCLYVVSKIQDEISSLKSLEEKVQFLQRGYQEGSRLYEEDEVSRKEIDELNKNIYEKDPSIEKLWKETRQWSLDYYQQFEKKLGIVYDKNYFETQTAPIGKKLVMDNLGKVFEESDEAIIFHGEPFKLHTRVFINKFGNPTYEAKDLGLVKLKYNDWPFDECIITTASEQNEYFEVIFAAIEQIDPQFKGKLKHIGFGLVDLKNGKMSSRTGNIVSAVDLVEQVEKAVATLSDGKMDTTIQKALAQAAIKYAFLRSEAQKNISFDINESISINGNSGPYLLYTFVRCMSVLNKAGDSIISNKVRNLKKILRFTWDDIEKEELALLRTLPRFPEVIDDAAGHYAPHLVATYLFDLAQKFNTFYEKHTILKAEGDRKQFRLALTQTTAYILKNGLYLLGIEVLDKI